MQGLDICEQFYRTHGAPMLREQFPELEGLIAVGLAGSGSECFGYDDETSRDHDFEPGFCLFLPDEDLVDRRTAFALERAYSKLPREFMGLSRTPLSPVGGNRHGVIRMEDFFRDKTGRPDGALSVRDWFSVDEQALAEATNGRVFRDDLGALTDIRRVLSYFPDDVRLKKLAGHLLMMGQSGQYNYPRSVSRGDSAAAQLCAVEFVRHALCAIFLLNRRYMPYYKWSFRALRDLPRLSELASPLEYLISSPSTAADAPQKCETIEAICEQIAETLRVEGLSALADNGCERHAYAVNDRISDGEIRNLHILFAV